MRTDGFRAKLYRPALGPGFAQRCIYCGSVFEARDHYRPWSVFCEPNWLPACSACNTLFGETIHETLGERIADLRRRLLRKHGKSLRVNWGARIEGTTGMLRQALEAERLRVEFVRSRLRWADSMEAAAGWIPLEHLYEIERAEPLLGPLLRAFMGQSLAFLRRSSGGEETSLSDTFSIPDDINAEPREVSQ